MKEIDLTRQLSEIPFGETPPESCETPSSCEEGEFCFRALIIKIEAGYELNGMRPNELANKLRARKCEHSQALKMEEMCSKILPPTNNNE